MKIVDINLAPETRENAMFQIETALKEPEFAGKEVRLYITKHNKTFRGQPVKTEYASQGLSSKEKAAKQEAKEEKLHAIAVKQAEKDAAKLAKKAEKESKKEAAKKVAEKTETAAKKAIDSKPTKKSHHKSS